MSLDNLTPAEFIKWFQLGQAVRRMMGKGAEKYSYNGVVLPKLPVTDKPYAVIARIGSTYALDVMAEPFVFDGSSVKSIGPGVSYIVRSSGWIIFSELPNGTVITPSSSLGVVWVSNDVLNSLDGSVYFAASEPIPVYE